MSSLDLFSVSTLYATPAASGCLPAKARALQDVVVRLTTGDWDMPSGELELTTMLLLAAQRATPEDVYLPVLMNIGGAQRLFTVRLLTGEARVCLFSEVPDSHPIRGYFSNPQHHG